MKAGVRAAAPRPPAARTTVHGIPGGLAAW
jgi:hypothetical protein